MVTPRAARSAASPSATSRPYGVARREPTMAMASASSVVERAPHVEGGRGRDGGEQGGIPVVARPEERLHDVAEV